MGGVVHCVKRLGTPPVSVCDMLELALALAVCTQALADVQIERLPVFFKQRDNYFFPAWTFVIPTTIMRLPVSFIESLVYTVITYFEIDLAPTAGRWALTPCPHSAPALTPTLPDM